MYSVREIQQLQFRLQAIGQDYGSDLEVQEALEQCVSALDLIQCERSYQRVPTRAERRADRNARLLGLSGKGQ